jgi:hypothetical protein
VINAIKFSIEEIEASDQYFDHTGCQPNRVQANCGQPVTEGQEFLRSDDGIRHALCVFDPAFAKHVRELELKTGQ